MTVHVRISIRDMIEACREEAYRIETVQRHLVEDTLRAEPDPGQIRKKEVFDAAALLLERIEPHLEDLKAVVRRKQWAGRR